MKWAEWIKKGRVLKRGMICQIWAQHLERHSWNSAFKEAHTLDSFGSEITPEIIKFGIKIGKENSWKEEWVMHWAKGY